MDTNRHSLPVITQIKYEKTSCYFCNEWLDSQSFKEHLIHCGQVLEKCPNSCSSYVQRKRMRSHMKECPKVVSRTNGHSTDAMNVEEAENRMIVLEQDVNALRSVLNEEIRQRLHLITDVGSLRKHNQITDEWTSKMGDALENLKACINEESEARCQEVELCQNDVRYCIDLNQTLRSELQHEINGLQKQILELSFEIKRGIICLTENIQRIEETMDQREKSFRLKIKQIETSIEALYKDLQSKFVSNSELNAKQMTLDYEVKSMKNIVCDTEEKCERLEGAVRDFDKALHQSDQTLADLKEHLAYQHKMSAIQNTRGHLIWRISDYSKKLEEARKYDTILHSPIFCNKPFGYTLRMDVHLNGKGTWKGRNIIACITVMNGDFDPLLQWPCRLKADLIIRDQSEDLASREDYVKTIVVKRKNEDFHNNQYFHIPHKIAQSPNYLKNDSLFFEIKTHKAKNF